MISPDGDAPAAAPEYRPPGGGADRGSRTAAQAHGGRASTRTRRKRMGSRVFFRAFSVVRRSARWWSAPCRAVGRRPPSVVPKPSRAGTSPRPRHPPTDGSAHVSANPRRGSTAPRHPRSSCGGWLCRWVVPSYCPTSCPTRDVRRFTGPLRLGTAARPAHRATPGERLSWTPAIASAAADASAATVVATGRRCEMKGSTGPRCRRSTACGARPAKSTSAAARRPIRRGRGRAGGDRAQPGVVVGYHGPARPRRGSVLATLRHLGPRQPIRGGVASSPAGRRGVGRRGHPGDGAPPGRRPGPTDVAG
jgi:hypothetical protein